MNLSDWDKFQSKLKQLGDYEGILEIYNNKVK